MKDIAHKTVSAKPGTKRTPSAFNADLPETTQLRLYSMEELARDAKAGWHRTYQLSSRTFMVHLDFRLPRVEQMHIFTLRWGETEMPEGPLPEDLDEMEPYGFGFVKNALPACLEEFEVERMLVPEPWDLAKDYLGNNGLTIQEALTFIQDKVNAFCRGRIQIAPDSIWVIAPEGHCGIGSRKSETKAHYDIQFRQLMGGVPILGSAAVTLHPSLRDKGCGYPVPFARIASTNEYWFGMSWMREEETVCRDVPLYPFPAMLEKWEALVLTGMVKDIHSIRLGYVLYMDDEDKTKGWAIPSWVMRCLYQDGLAQEAESHYEKWSEVIFNAQTGQMEEVASLNPRLLYRPPVLDWDASAHPRLSPRFYRRLGHGSGPHRSHRRAGHCRALHS